MNRKIYLVTEGNYSDYHVCAAFSTRALAERYVGLHKGELYSERQIEEVPLDEIPVYPPGLLPFEVVIERSGEAEADLLLPEHLTCPTALEKWGSTSCRVLHVWARNDEHAIKIANEQRLQAIANGEWA